MLGKKVKDKVTGFKGIATARVEFIGGCIQYCVKPKSQDNKMPEGVYVDVEQLEVVGDGPEITPRPTGGNQVEVPRG